MIEARGLTKRYGDKIAVDDLTFTVQPGIVTGFLGPNGAGKSTTMRMILGLDAPTAGQRHRQRPPLRRATPRRCARSARCWRPRAVHTGRTRLQPPAGPGRHHRHPGAGSTRSSTWSGCSEVARKRAGGFSLGMGQRLGIASALLGDPRHADPRRAGQRPRPRGHPVDPQPAQVARRRGPHGLRLLAPDERDGADRRAADHHRPRPADRRRVGGGVHPRVVAAAASGSARRRRRRCATLLAGPGRHRHHGRGRACWRSTGWTARTSAASRPSTGSRSSSWCPAQASLEEAFMELTRDAVEYHGRSRMRRPSWLAPEGARDGGHDARERPAAAPASAGLSYPRVIRVRVDQAAVAAVDGLHARRVGRHHRRPRHPGLLVRRRPVDALRARRSRGDDRPE